MNISKTNPLRRLYRYWVRLGGEPRKPEDLCHFMRVCLFHWWYRWLFSNTDRKGWGYDRFPRIIIFVASFILLWIMTVLMGEGYPWWALYVGLALFAAAVVAFIHMADAGVAIIEAVRDSETVHTFREWKAARNNRYCPFVTFDDE